MKAIETENAELKDVLPKSFHILDNSLLMSLLKTFNSIVMDVEGDVFGKIYEYFLGKFAMSEGQKGGEFFTPTSVVKLIVDIIEPFHGRIFDPACGSGGMFVQSARFVQEHKSNGTLTPGPSPRGRGENAKILSPPGRDKSEGTEYVNEISVYGCERVAETVRLCRMNLAVHGLSGDIRQGNSYYEDIHESVGKFDYVMANPPFNVSKVDKERIKDDPRFPFGIPKTDNANYLWIQQFYSSLNEKGRAGFVMANSVSDARASEMEVRRQLIQDKGVDVMVAVGSNFFYTVTLPCTLWFLDKAKSTLSPSPKSSPKGRGLEKRPSTSGRGGGGEGEISGARYSDTILFIDARHIYRQVTRAVRDFTPEQTEFLANIVALYRGEAVELTNGSQELLEQHGFPKFPSTSGRGAGGEGFQYIDVLGLCRVATISEIEEQGWSLNPGRYVGVADREEDDFDFYERLEELNEELEVLNSEARELEDTMAENVATLLESGR